MAAVVTSGGAITSVDLSPGGGMGPPIFYPGPPLRPGERRQPASPDTYWYLWRSQPAVRTVVSFLARNVAQVGLHVFRRVESNDRQRLRAGDHPAAAALLEPNPETTQYRMLEAVAIDLGVYDFAYLVKIDVDGRPGLRRLSPRSTLVTIDALGRPTNFTWRSRTGMEVEIPPEQMVWFRGWCDLFADAVPPLETLREVLDEDAAAVAARQRVWERGPQLAGWIERPLDAPEWTDAEAARFRAQFRNAYSALGGDAGGVPVLEDGMQLHDSVLTPEQAQYAEVRKLTRAEAAAAYHVPPTMVGLIEGATYSNTREHHSMLYTDTLGPIFAALEQEFALQLIADLDPSGEVYCEANIAEKLQGDFVDQTTAISSAVGAPWMTRSEARAIMNLPHDPDGDDLVVPLNVIVGGQASPRDSAPPPKSVPALKRADGRGHRAAKITAGLSGALAGVYRDWGRVAGGTLGRGGTPGEIDQGQLAGRYSDAARPHLVAAAHAGAQAVIDRYGGDPIAEDRFDGWAATTAERAAGGAASSYVGRIGAAIVAGAAWSDAVDQTTEDYTARADTAADSLTTPADSVGRSDAAESTGLRYKVWTVTSANPRASHAALDGEAVPLYEAFSNGAQWPGDTEALDIDETAGCTCQLDFAQEGP